VDVRHVIPSVYAKTRAEELAVLDWTEPRKDAFLRSQFNAQDEAHQEGPTMRPTGAAIFRSSSRTAGPLDASI
jgi:hypothetical protein